jgi:hypothetical protein
LSLRKSIGDSNSLLPIGKSILSVEPIKIPPDHSAKTEKKGNQKKEERCDYSFSMEEREVYR